MHRFISIFMKICKKAKPPNPQRGNEQTSKEKTPPLGAGGLLSCQEKLEWE